MLFHAPRTMEDNLLDLDELRRYELKFLKFSSNVEFLEACLEKSYIPKGFCLKWKLNSIGDFDIKEKCEKVKKDASLKFVELALQSNQRKLGEVRHRLSQVEGNEIFRGYSISEVEKIKSDLSKRKQRKLRELTKRGKNADDGGLERIKVSGDGNCFYRCISIWKYGNEHKHADIRNEIISHMSLNAEIYKEYVDGDFYSHINDQRNTDGNLTSWATEAEVYGATGTYGILLYVHEGLNIQKFEPIVGVSSNKSVHVLLKDNHFDLLIPNEKRDVTKFPSINLECGYHRTDTGVDNNYKETAKHRTFDWFDMTQSTREGENSNDRNEHSNDRQMVRGIHSENIATRRVSEDRLFEGQMKDNTRSHKSVSKNENKKNGIVTNLSSRDLSTAEIDLLSKGFSFIPTTRKINKWKVQSDLAEWERRMRLREFFFDENIEIEHENRSKQTTEEWLTEKKKSHFTPNPGRDRWLDAYIEAVKKDVMDGIQDKIDMNLTRKEEQALQDLLAADDIIIRPADKGSGIVVMDTEKYIESLEKEMKESKSYEKVGKDEYAKSEKFIKKKVDAMVKQGMIGSKMKKYLVPKYHKPGRLKGNPKLHKKERPLRTIVNGIGTPTERMAHLAERELDDYVTSSPSYIKDTTDF